MHSAAVKHCSVVRSILSDFTKLFSIFPALCNSLQSALPPIVLYSDFPFNVIFKHLFAISDSSRVTVSKMTMCVAPATHT